MLAALTNASAIASPIPADPTHPTETWMVVVIAATIAFLVAVTVNSAAMVRLALYSDSPELSHVFDQQLVVLTVWGVLVPTIWGFNARWLPVFAGFKKPQGVRLLVAYGLSVVGARMGEEDT